MINDAGNKKLTLPLMRNKSMLLQAVWLPQKVETFATDCGCVNIIK